METEDNKVIVLYGFKNSDGLGGIFTLLNRVIMKLYEYRL